MSQVRFSPLLHALPTRAPQEDFDAKVAFVKSWTYGGSKVTNDEKLTCYGLYKRVAPAPQRARPSPTHAAQAGDRRRHHGRAALGRPNSAAAASRSPPRAPAAATRAAAAAGGAGKVERLELAQGHVEGGGHQHLHRRGRRAARQVRRRALGIVFCVK